MYDDAKRHGRVWDHRGEQEIGRQFMMTITEVEAAVCSYHRANWADIAEQSVRIIRDSPAGVVTWPRARMRIGADDGVRWRAGAAAEVGSMAMPLG